jgi:hypothetical protein
MNVSRSKSTRRKDADAPERKRIDDGKGLKPVEL